MNKTKNSLLLFAVFLLATCLLAACKTRKPYRVKKPVVYLYPEKEQRVSVKLKFNGTLRATYPVYKNSWDFVAGADGTLTDLTNGEKYQYLFYDGLADAGYAPFTEGFSVKTDTVVPFLQRQLKYLGLKDREYHDMISYWLPELNEKPYSLIRFRVNKNCDEISKLDIHPKPDTEIRVMIEFLPTDEYRPLPLQKLEAGQRKGFTVVEWGGTNLEGTYVQ